MNTYAQGTLKKEIVEVMEPYIGIGFTKEFKLDVGQSVAIYSNDLYDETVPVHVYLRYKKIEISKDNLNDYFNIEWKHGCYNTCIRNGIPCAKLPRVPDGATHLTMREAWTCSIGWEVGRGDCSKYESQ
ncbi:hypothetical protein [Brevibacillus brevis]|uniref:hypothetical protein n=1 Tax=Brevibacillus brevis TaxID=1393 RepID=UPI0007D8B66B|nr:hypothetical protein [Brevibacillus brevis]